MIKVPRMDLCNIYSQEIGDGTLIGAFVEIQKGAKIGKNCKIESHSFICDGVTIGDNVFIGHGVMFINDKYPKVNNKKWKVEKTIVGNDTAIGSNSTILPVKIGKNCLIGAGSVITKDIKDGKKVKGIR